MYSTNPTNPGEDLIMPVVLSIFFGDRILFIYILFIYIILSIYILFIYIMYHHQPPLRSFA